MSTSHHLFVLVGPSAVGKTFWAEKLITAFPGKLSRVRNTTTRPPRSEADRLWYRFITKEQFEAEIKEGGFCEYDSYLDHYYGSSLKEMKRILADSSGVLAITPKGAEAIWTHREKVNPIFLFFRPLSLAVLERNYERRGEHDMAKRMRSIQEAHTFTLPPHIIHHNIIVMGDEVTDREKVRAIIEPLLA